MGRLMFDLKNPDCLYGGCEEWRYSQNGGQPCYIDECWRCGHNVLEAARRQRIPLTKCEDGLMRKLIPKKP